MELIELARSGRIDEGMKLSEVDIRME
jgi:hypothetical protein